MGAKRHVSVTLDLFLSLGWLEIIGELSKFAPRRVRRFSPVCRDVHGGICVAVAFRLGSERKCLAPEVALGFGCHLATAPLRLRVTEAHFASVVQWSVLHKLRGSEWVRHVAASVHATRWVKLRTAESCHDFSGE